MNMKVSEKAFCIIFSKVYGLPEEAFSKLYFKIQESNFFDLEKIVLELVEVIKKSTFLEMYDIETLKNNGIFIYEYEDYVILY